MVAACYIRVSTEEQVEFSPDAQLRAIKDYCSKNNIELDPNHIYIDAGISGKKAEARPEFMNMIHSAKKKPKPFDMVLVHKFDRFARNREDSVVFKSLLRKDCGVKVISITEHMEDDKSAVILEAMYEAMAEYYSLNLSEEVKKGQIEKVRQGGNVSKLPYGYSPKNKGIIIVEEEAIIIRTIFQMFLEGKGRRRISKYLDSIGIRAKTGKPLSVERIDYILNNPIYAGYIRRSTDGQFNKDWNNKKVLIIKGKHQAIIKEEQFVEVQKKIQLQKQLYCKYQKNRDNPHWLNGLLRCSNCGKVLVRYTSRGITYYQCSGYFKGQCKVSHSIVSSNIERAIIDLIKGESLPKVKLNIKETLNDFDNENALINSQIEKLKEKEKRIMLAFQNGIDTIEEYKNNKENIKKEMGILNSKLFEYNKTKPIEEVDIKPQIKAAWKMLKDKNEPMSSKYKAAHILISNIVYNKKEGTLFVEYNRVNIYNTKSE